MKAGDAITSAYAQKQPLITESDLRKYFDLVGIVIPRYPGEDLISILDSLLGAHADLGKGRNSHSDSGNGRTSGEGRGNAGGNERDERGVEGVMRTATHLLSCHLYAAQRRWATISARSSFSFLSLPSFILPPFLPPSLPPSLSLPPLSVSSSRRGKC